MFEQPHDRDDNAPTNRNAIKALFFGLAAFMGLVAIYLNQRGSDDSTMPLIAAVAIMAAIVAALVKLKKR